MNHRLSIEHGRLCRRAKEPVRYVGLETWGTNFISCSINHVFNTHRMKTILSLYRKNPNALKFYDLMNTEGVSLLTKVASFCKTIVMFFVMVNK